MRFFQILAVAFAAVASATPLAEDMMEENVAVIHLPKGCKLTAIAKCIYHIGKKTPECRDAIKKLGKSASKDLACLESAVSVAAEDSSCKKCIPHKTEVVEG
ncbi:hypothetical protein E4U55_000500 [Claviceps digitariae]|nr:hypothetical protein E4U55_000500 [Claviceps digitariae]